MKKAGESITLLVLRLVPVPDHSLRLFRFPAVHLLAQVGTIVNEPLVSHEL